jgi:ABC-type uncharacterized transport system substrate-binding protein
MRRILFVISAIFFTFSFAYPVLADDTNYSTTPKLSAAHQKWRIGYLQGGDYIDYRRTLLATVQGLVDLGWIKPVDVQKISGSNVEGIWQWLAKESQSDYLNFVPDAFYTARWEASLRDNVVEALDNRILKKGDIDLIIAMGTWAGQDVSKKALNTNVLVMSASDPVASGIIKSPLDSGAMNLHAHVDPTLFERQIRLFHEFVKFNNLGVIFENSVTGRSYAGIESAERVSKEVGFDIVTCFAVSDIPDTEQCEKAYLKCVDNIASKVDALYVTLHGGVNDHSISLVAQRSLNHRVATFSQSGSQEVEKGLLMSMSRNNFKKVGLFHAAIMAKVFNGAKPGELNQVFEEPLNISLNLYTAKIIGYMPSAAAIAAADEIYQKSRIQD